MTDSLQERADVEANTPEEMESGLEEETLSEPEGRIDDPFDPEEIRIDSWNPTISLVIKRLKYNELVLSPGFQREDVWNKTQKSQLIESILMKIPLPAFYFDATKEGQILVVDGQQRLTAIRDFVLNDKHDDEIGLTLQNLEYLTELEGKRFSELERKYQRRIMEEQIQVFRLLPGTPENVRRNVFKRLNTGGEPLSKQEIRHALHQGPATKLLNKLAETEEFKAATAEGVSPKRMRDRELILRFLAFLTDRDKYEGKDFDGFLHDHMQRLNEAEKKHRENLEAEFRRTMHTAHQIFDDDAFRKRTDPDANRRPISKALFEAWACNLADLSNDEHEILIERRDSVRHAFIELMNEDDEFVDAISVSTDKLDKVDKRFEAIRNLLEGQLE
jgi:hypothetical protein